ncbi:hypothetical protein ACXR0O_16345 [Verrucomicrobiota bacterium sgz303538]
MALAPRAPWGMDVKSESPTILAVSGVAAPPMKLLIHRSSNNARPAPTILQ